MHKFDQKARVARLRIPGVLETEVEPIKNPVTGQPRAIKFDTQVATARWRM